jgi:hypothetical protein
LTNFVQIVDICEFHPKIDNNVIGISRRQLI